MKPPKPKLSHSLELANSLRGWKQPVLMGDESVPARLQGYPQHLRFCFIASGELQAPMPFISPHFGDTRRVGGIYVVRNAPDGPKPFDRDDYYLVPDGRNSDCVWIDGPYRHPTEHWADEHDISQLISVCVL